MNKKILVAAAALVVVGGGAAFALTRPDKTNKDQASQQTSAEDDSTVNANFDPLTTGDTSFVATIDTTNEGQTTTGQMEYDKNNDALRFTSTSGEEVSVLVYTKDAYYFCQSEDTCYKAALSQSSNSSFDRGLYEYSAEEIAAFRNTASYQGKRACPSGSCDTWKVSADGYDTTLYIDAGSKRITQVEGTSSTGTSKIVYDYKDVTVTPPANAQELPALQGIGN